jgi:hypothetical protein
MPISTLEVIGSYRQLVPQRSAIWLHRASKPSLWNLPKLWKNSYIRSDKTRKQHRAYNSMDVHEISRLNLARVTPCVSKIKKVYTILQSARCLFFYFSYSRRINTACVWSRACCSCCPAVFGGCVHVASWHGLMRPELAQATNLPRMAVSLWAAQLMVWSTTHLNRQGMPPPWCSRAVSGAREMVAWVRGAFDSGSILSVTRQCPARMGEIWPLLAPLEALIPSPNTTIFGILWPPSIAPWGSLVPPYTLFVQ